MAEAEAGLARRLFLDSMVSWVKGGLSGLGWFEANRQHAPVEVAVKTTRWDENIKPNVIAVMVNEVQPRPIEMGTNRAVFDWGMEIITYLEPDNVRPGLADDVIGDLVDILRGTLGAGPTFPILDFRQDPPPQAGYGAVQHSTIRVSRDVTFTERVWQMDWREITFTATEVRSEDEG